MRVPGLQRLGVLGRRGAPHAHRLTGHQRHPGLAAEHVTGFGRLVDELVDGAQREIREAHLDHRPGAGHGGADGGAHDGGFGYGGVDDALGAEQIRETGVLPEHAAASQVLAQRPDRRVAPHFLFERRLAGLQIGAGRHGF